MTLDCSNTNRDGPSRFRSEADNPDKQVCYFNTVADEQVYNEFIAKRIKSTQLKNEIQFEITDVKSKTNKSVVFDVSNQIEKLIKENDTEASGFSNVDRFRTEERGRNKTRTDRDNAFSTRKDNVTTTRRAKPGYLYRR